MSEPMFDDMTIAFQEEFENKDLVAQLWQYILTLEEYIVRLRNQVNSLTDNGREPYPDPASDFAIRFYDHSAYEKYSDALENEEVVWKIPD